MGDSAIVKRFRRLLEECEKEHVFNGTIRELDTPIEYAQHLVRGIKVESHYETRQIRFARDFRNELDMEIGPLNTDDEVVVLGCQSEQKGSDTFPRIILLPKERIMILARTREPMGWQGGWYEWGFVGSIIVAIALSAVGSLAFIYDSFNFNPFDLYSFVPWTIMGVIFFFIAMGIEWYNKFSKRERVLDFNSEEWDEIIETIAGRFPSVIGQES